jgi:hypothetical protein
MADYFAIQLGRFGIVSASLTVGIDRHLPAPFLTTAATARAKLEHRTQRTRGPQPLSGSRPQTSRLWDRFDLQACTFLASE